MIGPVEVPNRLYQPAYCTMFGEGMRNALFRAEKAKGGFGLIIQEWTAVMRSADLAPIKCGNIWNLSLLHEHEIITRAVHKYGAKIFLQVVHPGERSAGYAGVTHKIPVPAPSTATDPTEMCTTKEMEEEDFEEIINAFAEAVIRARIAGYDGVQLNAAHSYLHSQFLSPYWNKRGDEYSAENYENRIRFIVNTLKRMREECRDEIALSVRFTVSWETTPKVEFSLEDGIECLKRMYHLGDFWDIDIDYYGFVTPSTIIDENYQIPYVLKAAKLVKEATGKKIPVGVVGFIRNPDSAVNILKDGIVDMIGLARQSTADPHWPKKVKEGRLEDIRECIGCNNCRSGYPSARPILCTQNVTAGEEYNGFYPEEFDEANEKKNILCVGGGVSGMEFARVAALRGHVVHLHEAEPELGGHYRLLAQLPHYSNRSRVIEWLERQLKKIPNVNVYLNSKMGIQDIKDYGADTVVFATGAEWDRSGSTNALTRREIPGWNIPGMSLTPPEILEALRKNALGEKILIAETDGRGCFSYGLASLLRQAGRDVYYAAYFSHGAPWMDYRLEYAHAIRTLWKNDVKLLFHVFPYEIKEKKVALMNFYTGEVVQEISVDHVVFTTQRKPRTELYKELKTMLKEGKTDIKEIYLTGEAVSPLVSAEPVAMARYWAHKLAREI